MASITEITNDELIEALRDWAAENPEHIVGLVAEEFDVTGQQEAVRVRPKEIQEGRVDGSTGTGSVHVLLDVLYRNPAYEDDEDLAATNIVDKTVALTVKLDLRSRRIEELDLVRE